MKRSSVVLRARSSAASRFAADLSAMRSSPASVSSVELEEIGRASHQSAVDQLIDDLVAEAFDIERATAGKVQQRLLALRAANSPPVQRVTASPSSR